jgi:tRNA(adenine34) deaminase
LEGLRRIHRYARGGRVKKKAPSVSPEVKFMGLALKLAHKAHGLDEVPVGAVVVQDGRVIASAHNLTESRQDPCGHAELLAIRKAAKMLGRWRLTDCTLYVTLEPCAMCAGAIVWSRMKRVVYGAKDPKAGACGSVMMVAAHGALNHRASLAGGVLAKESSELLVSFFKSKRKK